MTTSKTYQLGGSGARWRHVRRRSVYEEIAVAELQAATRQPREGDRLVIYRNPASLEVYARWEPEFLDGRFEPVQMVVSQSGAAAALAFADLFDGTEGATPFNTGKALKQLAAEVRRLDKKLDDVTAERDRLRSQVK